MIDRSLKKVDHLLIYFCTGCHQNSRCKIQIDVDCLPVDDKVQCSQCGYEQPILPGDIRDLKDQLRIVRVFRYHCNACNRTVKIKIEFNQLKKLKSNNIQCPLCHHERGLTEKEQRLLENVASVSNRAILFVQILFFYMLVQLGVAYMTAGGFSWQMWVAKVFIGAIVAAVLAYAILPVKR